MKPATTVRRVVLSIIGVFIAVAVAAGGIGVQAAQSSPDFAMAISPTSQSVQRGAIATYIVTVTSLNGFNGGINPVSLTVSGGPTGTSLPSGTLKPTAGVPATTTVTVTTSNSTGLGTYTITVSGVNGKLKHSATTGLTVNPIPPSFSLVLTPATLSVDAGSQGTYNVALTRDLDFHGAVGLSFSDLPELVTGSFTPTAPLPDGVSSATLTITVNPSAKERSGAITVTGTSGSLKVSAQGTLVIAKPQGKPFTISGNVVGQLAPGVTQPIDLQLFNTNKGFISVTNLTVSLTSTNKSSCPANNFEVTQYSGTYPIAVPPNDSTWLHTRYPSDNTKWPAIKMINRTDTVLGDGLGNQDGCKDVSLALSYSGSAQGN